MGETDCTKVLAHQDKLLVLSQYTAWSWLQLTT